MRDLSSERWQHLDRLVDEALARPRDERTAFLRARCGEDPDLYGEVLALVARLDEAEDALGESVGLLAASIYNDDEDASDDALPIGTHIGAYRIEEEIGRGGMGVVYRAARADGAFDKEVALKLVKRGMDTDEVLARFRRERQLLAGLDHPGIARLLDGGAADDGRPFLAMEYVEGEPITEYCDERHVNVEDRLDLFGDVCEAVQHAHRRLVIHRDLKPNNILVSEAEGGEAKVKLLDFGIAKLLQDDDDDAVTRTGAQRLTPAYAAPEQIRGAAVSTAADVYALGVVLYELLTGARHDAPLRQTSTVVTTEAAVTRGTTVDGLRRQLRGDLDTIVQAALREEPSERYPSVESLLEDLRRHRAGLPIQARQASAGYRMRKFVGRHRTGVSVAAAFAVLLVASAVALAFQQRQAERERDRAEEAAEEAREVTRFLASTFDEGSAATGGEVLSASEVIDRGMLRVEEDLAGNPALQARLYYIFGGAYERMNHYDDALRACGRALDLQERLYGPVHPEVASSVFCLGSAHFGMRNNVVADSLFDRYERLMTALPDEQTPEHAQRMAFMGRLLFHRGEAERARAYRHRAFETYRALQGLASKETINAGAGLAQSLAATGRADEAVALLQDLVAATDRLDDEERDGVRANVFLILARAYESQNEFDQAREVYREAIAIMRGIDAESATLASWQLGYGQLLLSMERHGEAETVLREAHTSFGRAYGATSFYALHVQRMLGEAVSGQGRHEEAEPMLQDAYAQLRAERGLQDAYTQGSLKGLVALYEAWGQPTRADGYRALLEEEEPQ